MNSLHDLIIEKAYDIYNSYPCQSVAREVNADNIAAGRLGFSFFLLELHRKTIDMGVWEKMMEELGWLESYAVQHPTNNYTFIRGRSGLAFLYLELFRHSGDHTFLQKATTIVKEYYEGNSYKYGIISDYSLFEGISGILLLSLHLYLYTKEPWLLEHIEKLLLKLVHGAHTREGGVCWGGITDLNKKNISLASGAAGIAFVLAEFGKCFDNELLTGLARRGLDYEKTFWERQTGTADDHENTPSSYLRSNSLCYGKTGMSTVRFYLDAGAGAQPQLTGLTAIGSAGNNFLSGGAIDNAVGVFSGISGIGLALTEAYRISGEEQYLSEAVELAERLVTIDMEQAGGVPLSMNGWLGMGYFLLQLINPGSEGSGLFFLPQTRQVIAPDALPPQSIFKPGNREILRVIINRDFQKTASTLNEIAPETLATFFDHKKNCRPEDFVSYVEELMSNEEEFPFKDILSPVFELEKFAFSFKNSVQETVPHGDDTILYIDEIMHLSNDDFRSLKLVLTDKIRIYSRDNPISEDMRFTKKSFAYFLENYGTNSFLYKINAQDNLDRVVLGVPKIVFDKFISVTPVHEAHDQLAGFLMRQDKEVLSVLAERFHIKGKKELQQALWQEILDGIRFGVMEGVLEVSN